MRGRFWAVVALVGLAGCSSREPDSKGVPKVDVAVAPMPVVKPVEPEPKPAPIPGVVAEFDVPPIAPTQVDANTEKYDAALTEALVHLADRKYGPALEAFETAKAFKDTEFVRGEIAKLKSRVDQDAAAQRTVAEIETVLEQGKTADASPLITKALREYGDRDVADRLVQFRMQADALQNAAGKEDDAVRFQRLRDEGMAALQDQNLRAASIAFEQALQIRDDAAVRDHHAELQSRLRAYDGLRKNAAELRRDPARIEEAIGLLKDAAKAWDTLQVRQELDEASLALQRRRDTLSVADFEVGQDLGFGDASRLFAEEMLPHFKARFELVERAQVSKVAGDLGVSRTFRDDLAQQREVGRLAQARYLVLGSVRRLGSAVASARLVDTRTGLVVQTARVSAPTVEALLGKIPELAKQLLMSDDEKLAYDAQVAHTAQRVEPIPETAALPPPPIENAPRPAPLYETVAPPAFANLTVAQFQALPAPPAQPPTVLIVEPPAPVVRHRLVHSTLLLGDDCFAQRRFRDAFRHFEFALSLAPDNFDIRVRLDRCRPFLPPPAVVVVQPTPIFVVPRPRLAILNFLVVGDPRVVPPSLSSWTPSALAPYFASQYEIVDQAEVFWMMGRLGMTVPDLMNDPSARRWLGRSLNVQAFLLGTIEQTASFNVSTHLLNAEHGYQQGSAMVHVRTPFELKLRVSELAQVTLMPPAQRVVHVQQENRFDVLVRRGNDCLGRRDFGVAITVFEEALSLRPGNLQIAVYLNQARSARRQWELEEARRQDFLRQQAAAEASRRRQWELAQAAEAARIRAAQEAAARAEAERHAFEGNRLSAYGDLVTKARVAVQGKNFALAINLFQGALDLAPPPPPATIVGVRPPPRPLPVTHDVLLNELAHAKAESARAQEQKALAEKVAAQESALRQKREQELAAAKQQIEDQQKLERERALANKKLLDAKYDAAFNQGQLLMSQGKYESAVVALQNAKQLRKTEAVDAMLNLALQRQAEAAAKGDAEKAALEKKLVAARERAKVAEVEAKLQRERYDDAMKLAAAALAANKLDEAQTHYTTASKFFNTDAALTGLKRVDAARSADAVAQKAVREKAEVGDRVAKLVAEAKVAFDAGDLAGSSKKLQFARKLDPTNVAVLAESARVDQARDRALAEARRKSEDVDRKQTFDRLLASGQAALANKQYAAAVAALSEATKLQPGDPSAVASLAQARKALDANVAADAASQAAAKEAARKAGDHQKLLAQGRLALSTKRFDDAIAAFAAADKLLPGDPTAASFLKDASKAKQAEQDAVVAAAKDRAAKLKTQADFQKALADGRAALQPKNYAVARAALDRANALSPNAPAVVDALRELTQAEQTAAAETLAKEKAAKQYQSLVDAAQGALATMKYADALDALKAASALRPNDPATKALVAQAQKGLAAQQAAAAEAAAAKQYQALVAAAQGAIATMKYADALKSLESASALRPGDPTTKALVAQAQKGLADQQAAAAAQATAGQVQKLLASGRAALKANDFTQAAAAFQQAQKLTPANPDVAQALRDLDLARNAADQTRLKEFASASATGQKALAAKNYPAAIQAFNDALKIRPDDATVRQLLQQAVEGQNAAAKAAKAAEANAAQVGQLVAQAQKLMAQKQYAAAVPALNEALRLAPGHPLASALLRQAQAELAESANEQKKKAAYAGAIQAGQNLLAQKKYAEALQAFQAAKGVFPTDPTANALIQQTSAAWENAKKLDAPKPAPPKIEPKVEPKVQPKVEPKVQPKVEPKKADARAEYQQHMGEGQRFLAMRRFPDAIRSFEAALRAVPGDPLAEMFLARAKKAK